jgi:hypothetical protein
VCTQVLVAALLHACRYCELKVSMSPDSHKTNMVLWMPTCLLVLWMPRFLLVL